MRDRFVRFYNLPELMAVLKEVADIKTADMLDIPGLPAIQGGKARIVPTEATPAQRAIMAEFILRADAIRAGRVKPDEDNMLKLTSEARMMAIDPRMIVPTADGTGSALTRCIRFGRTPPLLPPPSSFSVMWVRPRRGVSMYMMNLSGC